jgi:predicted Zn-dependent peptidase
VERVEIDGVTVLWAPGPAPLRAVLTFGCGTRDETFRSIGVTHLIEHLAMSTLPRLHHEHNASVDLAATRFYAAGSQDQIVSFLERVCLALGNLPVERAEREAGVLAAEGGTAAHPTVAALLARRFGTQGYGLEMWSGPGYDRITPELIRAHAARFFVAGNAILQLTGPPPEGLRLPLPAGARARHENVVPQVSPGPLWSAEPAPSVGLSLLGAAQCPAWTIGMAVLEQRLTRTARHERGLSYGIDGEVATLNRDQFDRMIWLDAREGQEAAVAGILWDTVRELAEAGPTAEELDEEVRALKELFADPRSVESELDIAAHAELFDLDYHAPEELITRMLGVTPQDVAGRFREALDTALLVVPEDCRIALVGPHGTPVAEGGCARQSTVPAGRVARSPLIARALSAVARRVKLVLTTDGIAMCDPDGDVHRIAFAEVVGMAKDGDSRVVFGRNGCVIQVDPTLFRGTGAFLSALDANVPAHLHFAPSAFTDVAPAEPEGERKER